MTASHTKWVIPLLFIGLLLLPQAAGARAGVKVGDWAHYTVAQNISGNSTLVTSYKSQYGAYADTNFVGLNITAVSGTNVNITQGIYHRNGTLVKSTFTVDVSQPVDNTYTPPLIMQNHPFLSLSKGNFSNVQRTIDTFVVSASSGDNSSTLRYSWDNETGILLSEILYYIVDQSSPNFGTFAFTLSLTSTSLWHYVPPKNQPGNPPPSSPFGLEFAELYVLIGVVGAITVGVVAYAVRRSPKPKGNSRTSRTRSVAF